MTLRSATPPADIRQATSRRRLLVIYNPVAGPRRRRRLAAVLAALYAEGATVTLVETAARGDAERLARDCEPAALDAVVVAGGDGTINEVVNGLIAGRAARDGPVRDRPVRGGGGTAPDDGIALGVIPLGTANVLAAELGLPRAPSELARLLARGAARPIHLGAIELRAGVSRHFVMMAGIGLDAHVVDTVPLHLKRRLGRIVYGATALRRILRFPYPAYGIAAAGGPRLAVGSIVLANGRFYGGRFVCAPDARLQRPDLQACVSLGRGRGPALRYGAALLSGRLSRQPDIRVFGLTEAAIDGPPGDPIQADGDIIGRLPASGRVTVRLAARTLLVLGPGSA